MFYFDFFSLLKRLFAIMPFFNYSKYGDFLSASCYFFSTITTFIRDPAKVNYKFLYQYLAKKKSFARMTFILI